MIDSIIKGVKTVAEVMDAVNFFGGGKGDDDRGRPLVPPRVNFPGRVSTDVDTRRSSVGVPRFSDVPEATFYKYAQLQNTVRYLYNKKAGFKSIAKG